MAYKIKIVGLRNESGQGNNVVDAWLPDELALAIDHKWENPFEVELSKSTMTGIQAIGKWTGLNVTGAFDPSTIANNLGIDTMTYMGTSPMSITFNLQFVVDSDIQNDLIKPVKTLIKMSCPSGGSLSTLSSLKYPQPVSIAVPGVLNIPKCFITSVGADFGKPLVTDGTRTVPMRFTVPLTIVTAELPTQERIEAQLFV